ncbi:purine and uridine phosphorylase [Aspergillus avenaceus]|uniref:Purine and uridine phosphorylase n=1 Tax=Aspergillus avenaceus TaxID=36643 RepID=A0A5N6TFE6_ASPAV|nr:purine and uridine phosphorylase [Aspergillus avenaceus]
MATAAGSFRHQDYTVAWICALPLEMAAAAAMLDERHYDLPARPNDGNTYILGRIYGHNLAIACLPSAVYGTTSAATVATQMQSTFESIRFGLMIGIGGGVPTGKVDIRLGDVVVSKPTRDSGGVIQYDYGKTVTGGRFERTGVLNKPPPVLLTAVSRLQAEHELGPSRIPALLSEAVDRNPRMREKFAYRGDDQDQLFDSEYDHTNLGDTCNNCDAGRLVTRPTRASHDPVIHYGLIASGNQVVKHGHSRDKLARELDILCFEMEAAGLMDNFPCFVIRGISDYSDSHKNKRWQEYAAAAAAGYGKELLSVVHASHVVDTLPAGSISDVSYCREKPPSMKLPNSEIVRNYGQEGAGLLERISNYEHERIHQRLTRKRLTGTTHWFLDHPDFKAWFTEKRVSSLWCSGKIGSGKAMIATAAIDAAKYELGCPTVAQHLVWDNIPKSAIVCSFKANTFLKLTRIEPCNRCKYRKVSLQTRGVLRELPKYQPRNVQILVDEEKRRILGRFLRRC